MSYPDKFRHKHYGPDRPDNKDHYRLRKLKKLLGEKFDDPEFVEDFIDHRLWGNKYNYRRAYRRWMNLTNEGKKFFNYIFY